jgi:hypothetical protein
MLHTTHRKPSLSSISKDLTVTLGDLSVTTSLIGVTSADLEKLARDYFENTADPVIPIDWNRVKLVLPNNIAQRNFVGIIRKSNIIVGAIVAAVSRYEASSIVALQQTFYNSILTGIPAVKAVWAAHRLMIEYAKTINVDYAVSVCSFEDSTQQLNRILAKDGWVSRGHTSVWKIKE